MLEKTLFASFYTLERSRYRSPLFATGVSLSLLIHVMMLIFLRSLSIGFGEEEVAAYLPGGGRSIDEIVEVSSRPLIMPPPEVIDRWLQQLSSVEPKQPEYLAERSSIARRSARLRSNDRSRRPAGGGEGGEPGGGSGADAQAAKDMTQTEIAQEETSPADQSESAQESPPVIESTERLPTVASQQEPASTGQSRKSKEPNLPPVGEGPDVAALRETEPPSAAVSDQESVIHPRGPISVNAKGVGPVGAYLAYLERTIYRYWQIPPEANLLTQSVSLTIEFEIAKDGRLLSLRLYNSTGMRALDRAAMRAIQMAAPFRPLPDVFPGPSQLFTDTFIYHPPPSSS